MNEYSNYQNPQNSQFVQPVPKKSMSTFGKIMLAVCIGLFFGIFAGCGFYTVKLAYDNVSSAFITASADPAITLPRNHNQIIYY